MRQAGFEAAKKAGDAKKTKLFASSKEQEPDKLEGQGEKEGDVDEEALKKLDNSGPVGMPPPSGTTDAEDAKEPETAGAEVRSKADETASMEPAAENKTDMDEEAEAGDGEAGSAGNVENLKDEGNDLPLREGVKNKDTELEHPHGTMEPTIAAMGQKMEKEEGKPKTQGLEEDGGLKGAIEKRAQDEEDEDQGKQAEADQEAAIRTRDSSAATDKTENLPGKKTQDQEAAKGDEAGVSVAD